MASGKGLKAKSQQQEQEEKIPDLSLSPGLLLSFGGLLLGKPTLPPGAQGMVGREGCRWKGQAEDIQHILPLPPHLCTAASQGPDPFPPPSCHIPTGFSPSKVGSLSRHASQPFQTPPCPQVDYRLLKGRTCSSFFGSFRVHLTGLWTCLLKEKVIWFQGLSPWQGMELESAAWKESHGHSPGIPV